MKRHIAFEDDAELDDLSADASDAREPQLPPTDDAPADDTPAEDAPPDDMPSDSDSNDNDGDDRDAIANKPLKIPEIQDLNVTELSGMLTEQNQKDNAEVLEAGVEGGHVVLQKLDAALEHFRVACGSRSGAALGYAAEELAAAQDYAGVGMPEVIAAAAGEPTEAELGTAMEGLGSTVSTVIKAILAAMRKTLAFLKQFLKDVWRHLRSLQDAIKKRGDELVLFRKKYQKELRHYAEAQKVDFTKYVELGPYKAFLLLEGKQPGFERNEGYGFQLHGLTTLLSSSQKYDQFVSPFVTAGEEMLQLVAASSDGQIDPAAIEEAFKDVPSYSSLMTTTNYTPARLAHGLQATDETVLMISDEFLGNFFQGVFLPSGMLLSKQPTRLEKMAECKVSYTRDEARAMPDGFLRMLEANEIEDAQKKAGEQAQWLIAMQRTGDTIEHRLEQLTELLKKIDAQVWHNNQGDPTVAALKNQHLITLTRAVSAAEGTCHRFFEEVATHVRSVQYAWYSYLTANLKRDREILETGMVQDKTVSLA